MEAERTREELLDELVGMTRARDMLADTADRLIAERDRYREALERIERMTDRTVNRHREVSRGAISAVAREALRP
jgi:hypothetical protein